MANFMNNITDSDILKCPAIILYIILQIVILSIDIFSKKDFVRAFVHFWLGFIFYLGYKNELCLKTGNVYLGAEQILMVLAFVFFQFFLINYAMDINNSKTYTEHDKKEREERLELEKRERDLGFLKRNLELDHNNYKYIKVDSTVDEENIVITNNSKYNVKKGDVITLSDGRIRVVENVIQEGFSNKEGFSNREGFLNAFGNFFGLNDEAPSEPTTTEVATPATTAIPATPATTATPATPATTEAAPKASDNTSFYNRIKYGVKNMLGMETKTKLVLNSPVSENTQGYILVKDKSNSEENKEFKKNEKLNKLSKIKEERRKSEKKIKELEDEIEKLKNNQEKTEEFSLIEGNTNNQKELQNLEIEKNNEKIKIKNLNDLEDDMEEPDETSPIEASRVQVSGKRLRIEMVGGEHLGQGTMVFNTDGTVTHSARPDGTYEVEGLIVKMSDSEDIMLTFSKVTVETGDEVSVTGSFGSQTFRITEVENKNKNELEQIKLDKNDIKETQDSILQFDETYQKNLKNTNMDFGKMSKNLSPYVKNSFTAAAPHLKNAYDAALPHLSVIFTPELFQKGKVPMDKCLGVDFAVENYGTCCGNGGYMKSGRKEVCNDASLIFKRGIVDGTLAETSAVENPAPPTTEEPPAAPEVPPPVQNF